MKWTYIRYWDATKDRVQSRFWGSEFLRHARHSDLFQHFGNLLEGLDANKLLQVSMDGPNVNLLFLDVLKKSRQKNEISELIDIGSFNIHVVHGAFKTGTLATSWPVKPTLKGAFNLLHDSPARLDDFKSLGGSELPLFFCATHAGREQTGGRNAYCNLAKYNQVDGLLWWSEKIKATFLQKL